MNTRILTVAGAIGLIAIAAVLWLSIRGMHPSAPEAAAPQVASAPAARTPQAEPAPAPTPSVTAADEPFVVKRILPIEGAIKYG